MPRAPAGLIGYVLTDPSGAYWWRTTGGFIRIPSPFPLVLPTKQDALALARDLRKRFGVLALPQPLRLGAR